MTRVFPLPPQVVIPLCLILIVKKQNTALLVPNALSLRTSNGDKVSLALPSNGWLAPGCPFVAHFF